ncbi:MAG: hypothetical protein EXQ52_14235 [Bryobacterales bacterium]|nr:hypothetical protein [Bryobacterales bacterium]
MPCCGEARENTLDCPSGCQYRIEARKREKPRELHAYKIPHKEITLTEELVKENSYLLLAIWRALIGVASEHKTRDGDVLAILAFLQRLEIDQNNGRPRGRAFLNYLRQEFGVDFHSAAS